MIDARRLFPMLLATAALWLPSSATAQSADFTIHVPIRVTDLHPDVTEVGARCQINVGQNRLGAPQGFFYTERVPVSGPDFDQTVTAEMSFPELSDREKIEADGWGCMLYFGNGVTWGSPSAQADQEWMILLEGERSVSGVLPN